MNATFKKSSLLLNPIFDILDAGRNGACTEIFGLCILIVDNGLKMQTSAQTLDNASWE